jgi:hypothetical protein
MNINVKVSYNQKFASLIRKRENRKPSKINRIFALVTIILCIAAVVISIVFLQDSSITAQRCTVASFFMGLFGSVLFTHFLYSIWQFIVYRVFYEDSSAIPTA